MKFKRCSIGGTDYGDDETEEFEDSAIESAIEDDYDDVAEFFTIMATCHTVVPELTDGSLQYQSSSPDEAALVRGASSQGFVFAARKPKEIVVRTVSQRQARYRKQSDVLFQRKGEKFFQLLNMLEFSSDRKRMSVIVRDENGTIKIYCKGAVSSSASLLKLFNLAPLGQCHIRTPLAQLQRQEGVRHAQGAPI